jgi:hypothetical protein
MVLEVLHAQRPSIPFDPFSITISNEASTLAKPEEIWDDPFEFGLNHPTSGLIHFTLINTRCGLHEASGTSAKN